MPERTAQASQQGWLPTKSATRSGLLAMLVICCISGCGTPTVQKPVNTSVTDAGTACQNIQHPTGITQVCGPLQDIVALDPHALDLLLALGVQPIGYAEDRRALVGSPSAGKPTVQIKYLGDRLTHLPIHVGTQQTPSLETLLKLKPDLILGRIQPSLYANLTQIAPTVPLAFSAPWQASLLQLGKAMNREARAKTAIEQHQQRMAIAKNDLKPITQSAKVLLLSVSALNRIQIFTDETYAGGLLKELGFQLVIPKNLSVQQQEIDISLETLPQLQPDTIIVMASGNSSVEKISKAWWNNTILRSLPASQKQRVYFVDYQLWSRIEGPIAAELILNQIRHLLLVPKAGTKA